MPKARFKPTLAKKSGVNGAAIIGQHILVRCFNCTPHGTPHGTPHDTPYGTPHGDLPSLAFKYFYDLTLTTPFFFT